MVFHVNLTFAIAFFFFFLAWTALAVHETFRKAHALHVQIVKSREKILQKSGLYEAPPSGKLKNIMVFYGVVHALEMNGESSPVSCPQSHTCGHFLLSRVSLARMNEGARCDTIYTNHPVGNLVHKHKTIISDMVGERPATKYIQTS